MNYNKLHNKINDLIKYESDKFIMNINLKQNVVDKLFDYQIMHVINLVTALRSNNTIIDSSDTGTGKTYSSIALCKQFNFAPLIICPKTIISNWKEVCKYFSVEPLAIVNYEMIKNGKQYDSNGNKIKSKYVEVNELLKNEYKYKWNLPNYTLIIFDEAHRCKNVKSENGKLLLSTKNKKVLLLSATIADKPESFQIFGYMLGFYKSLRQANNWIKGMLLDDKNYIGIKPKISSIHKQIFPYRGSRIAIQDLGNKFPDNQICPLCYDLDDKDKLDVNNAFTNLKQLQTKLESINDQEIKKNILKEIIKARQKIELLKLPIFKEQIETNLENNNSVAVFVNFKNTLYKLAEYFKTDCLIFGDQDINTRDKNIKDFQNNKSHLILCTIQSGSEGISLHDLHGRQRISLISPTFSATDFKQCIGRIWRIGSISKAIQRVIFCSNSLEEIICNRLKEKLKFLDNINDDDLIKF
ncbi:DEAD/SNF2 helicase [uncultured virus]|nr:DEAD/SNF2 helicase [uncultured virus]